MIYWTKNVNRFISKDDREIADKCLKEMLNISCPYFQLRGILVVANLLIKYEGKTRHFQAFTCLPPKDPSQETAAICIACDDETKK